MPRTLVVSLRSNPSLPGRCRAPRSRSSLEGGGVHLSALPPVGARRAPPLFYPLSAFVGSNVPGLDGGGWTNVGHGLDATVLGPCIPD